MFSLLQDKLQALGILTTIRQGPYEQVLKKNSKIGPQFFKVAWVNKYIKHLNTIEIDSAQ
jgi:hypothetical protein